MRVTLGVLMDGWNGHARGETVGLEEGMRESLARHYLARGLVEFVEAEEGETAPTAKELKAFDRALKKAQAETKIGQRREVKNRAVDPGNVRKRLVSSGEGASKE